MSYIELECSYKSSDENFNEILIAELNNLGFESYLENESTLTAYIPSEQFDLEKVNKVLLAKYPSFDISFNHKIMENKNWNELWETNYYKPILIKDTCLIRSQFHDPVPVAKYEILINPKMSFGTGHHETTQLMVGEILDLDVEGKTILDLGCGTGILGILCCMRGAKKVTGIDIDEWAYNNSLENLEINHIDNMDILLGDINLVGGQKFDILIANINRNVLIQEFPLYAKALKKGGLLLISGFYASDTDDFQFCAENNYLEYLGNNEKKSWTIAKFKALK